MSDQEAEGCWMRKHDTLVTWGMLALILGHLNDGAIGGLWLLGALAAFVGSFLVAWRQR